MSKVFLNAVAPRYPSEAPFHPDRAYPELAAAPWAAGTASGPNEVYAGVRALLARAYPAEDGNYLGAVIRPGDTVVVKPNLVKAAHETRPGEWEQVVTHGAVLRPVLDYVLLALKGRGRVVVAEAPQTDTSFSAAAERSGVAAVAAWYAGRSAVPVELLDLRKEEWESADGIVVRRIPLPGDPAGYEAVDLGGESAFAETDGRQAPLYGADYDTDLTARHHSGGRHEYLLSATVLHCDVLINLPKLKTHKKTGLTCALKNLVGINGDKNWLPHYRLGNPAQGGDQFAESGARTAGERRLVGAWKRLMLKLPPWGVRLLSPLKALGRLVFGDTHKVVRSGNWHGNDTCWRMVWDLNLALRRAGRMRRTVTIVDGVIAGEGDGPLAPDAKPCGWLALGEDPQALDRTMAELMGFDPGRLPFLTRPLPGSGEDSGTVFLTPEAEAAIRKTTPFRPHFGWEGYVNPQKGL